MNATQKQYEVINSTAKLTVVIAGPGSGKTQTTAWRVQKMIESGVPAHRIVVLTFTNNAAKEISERIGHQVCYAGTLHGYVLRLLMSHGAKIGFPPELTILDEEDAKEFKLATLQELNFTKISMKDFDEALSKPITGQKRPIDLAVAAYLKKLERSGTLDYESMLLFGEKLVRLLAREGTVLGHHLFVDEVQDSGDRDFNIYQALPFLGKTIVGDPDQCQPPTTQIRMSDGSKRFIEHLKAGDSVVSFERHGKVLMQSATVTAISKRFYNGLMYHVSTPLGTSRSTGNHRWLIKWLSGAERDRSRWCVYMMRKGANFRIGKTCLFRSGGSSYNKGDVIGLPLRMRQECADAGWILTVHDTEGEALAHEDIIAATYGLPQTCFRSNGANRGYTQDVVDRIFQSVPNQLVNAVRCLQAHARELEFPLFHTGQPRTRRTVQEIHACNLLNDVMKVPGAASAYDYKNRSPEWVRLHVHTEPYQGYVYSLDVAKYHKYVADGLVTCNSIYSFRGGRLTHLLAATRVIATKTVALEENFRSLKNICEAAQRLIEHNKERFVKRTVSARPTHEVFIDGAISVEKPFKNAAMESRFIGQQIASLHICGVQPQNIAVLCRTNHLVNEMRLGIQAQGVQVAEKKFERPPQDLNIAKLFVSLLSNPNNDYLALKWIQTKHGDKEAKAVKSLALATIKSVNNAYLKLPAHTRPEEVSKMLREQGVSEVAIALVDACVEKLPANSDLHDLSIALNQNWAVDETVGEGCIVSTIHGAKGREWDVVFIAGAEDETIPGTRQTVNIEEERRLFYVAATRARFKLVITYCSTRIPAYGPSVPVPMKPSRYLLDLMPKTVDGGNH